MLTENTAVKINLGLMVTLIIGLLIGGYKVGSRLEQFDGRMVHMEEKAIEHDVIMHKVDVNSARLSRQDVTLAEIQTDLKWIRNAMEETK